MSDRAARLEARIATVRQLDSLVTAIRGIAAGRTHDSRSRLAAVRDYARTVAEALADALALSSMPVAQSEPAKSRKALILVCAEQGFAGAISEAVFEAAGRDVADHPLIVVGRRGIRLAMHRHLAVAWSASMVSRADSVGPLADAIGRTLSERLAAAEVDSADILFAVPKGSSFTVERRGLLPVDLTRFTDRRGSSPPLTNLAPDRLLRSLATEYIDAELRSALLTGFIAENLVRLAAMSRAHDHIAEQLEALCGDQRSARQESITAEILEVGVRPPDDAEAIPPSLPLRSRP